MSSLFHVLNCPLSLVLVGASQWPRPSGQTALSPNYEGGGGGLHALVGINSPQQKSQFPVNILKPFIPANLAHIL